MLGHGSARKFANLARTESERLLGRVRLDSWPYLLIVDPCSYCNLKCPLCYTGMGRLGRPQKMLSFAQFRACFDQLRSYLLEVSFHNWGEPLLNPEVYAMIAHAQACDVGTNLSTNLAHVTSDELEAIIASGLEYLVVSLDGASDSSYRQYRIGGEFHQVVQNLSELLRLRRLRRLKVPVVEWQFIVMRHNEHELASAKQMARQLGIDVLRFIPVGLPLESSQTERKALAEQWFPRTIPTRGNQTARYPQQFGQRPRRGPCFYLYRSLTVNADGGISPCCMVSRQAADFGHSLDSDLHSLWNNQHFISARALFSRTDVPHRLLTVCEGCDVFRQLPVSASN